MTEKDLCNSIIEFLNYQGFFCWRVNSGMVQAEYHEKKRLIRMARVGTSDIQGIRRKDGRMICLEVKIPGKEKTLTQHQRDYLLKMQNYGALAGMVTTPEQALYIVQGRTVWDSFDGSSLAD